MLLRVLIPILAVLALVVGYLLYRMNAAGDAKEAAHHALEEAIAQEKTPPNTGFSVLTAWPTCGTLATWDVTNGENQGETYVVARREGDTWVYRDSDEGVIDSDVIVSEEMCHKISVGPPRTSPWR